MRHKQTSAAATIPPPSDARTSRARGGPLGSTHTHVTEYRLRASAAPDWLTLLLLDSNLARTSLPPRSCPTTEARHQSPDGTPLLLPCLLAALQRPELTRRRVRP